MTKASDIKIIVENKPSKAAADKKIRELSEFLSKHWESEPEDGKMDRIKH